MYWNEKVGSHWTTYSVIQCLKQKFGDCLIVWYTAFSWPPPSVDLIQSDLFLLGHLKASLLFSVPVPDMLILKSQMRTEIGKIRMEMLQKVYENALARFHICIGNNGHLPNVILK